MKRDTRLSSMLHLLLHMAELGRPMISAELAHYLSTNPVVVRRTMSGLREAGLVKSEKGHGGGWHLTKSLTEISLADVYRALGSPALFAFGSRNESPQCLVEQSVNRALSDTMDEAEALILERLTRVSLADIREDFRKRHPHAAAHNHGASHHA